MAPRFGRCIDRIRNILSRLNSLPSGSREFENHLLQLTILYARTRTLRSTMTAAGICIFFVALTVAITFSDVLFRAQLAQVAVVTFLLALFWLVVLTVGFIYDFLESLKAVRLEIECGLGPDELGAVLGMAGKRERVAAKGKDGPDGRAKPQQHPLFF